MDRSTDTARVTRQGRAPRATTPLRTSPDVPAGQIAPAVTEAFLAFIAALDAHTPAAAAGDPGLNVFIRDRATGETAGTLPVTEDTAIAILAAHSTALNVRPTGTAPAEADAEPAPEHTRPAGARPAWVLDPARPTAPSVTRLRNTLARPLRSVPTGPQAGDTR